MQNYKSNIVLTLFKLTTQQNVNIMYIYSLNSYITG